MKLWVVLPVYFDADALEKVVREVRQVLMQKADLQIHFLVVDDSAGKDNQTRLVAENQNLHYLVMPRNMGHQKAIVYGLRWLSHKVDLDDYIVTMDADGEDRPADLLCLLDSLENSSNDLSLIALALRTSRKERIWFKCLYFCFKILFLILTGQIVRTGNFAAFRGSTLVQTIFQTNFSICYSSSLLLLNQPRIYVPCPRGDRYAGVSKMGFWQLAFHGFSMLVPFVPWLRNSSWVLARYEFAVEKRSIF